MCCIKADNLILSFREIGTQSSYFLNVHDVLKSEDFNKIKSVYKNILFNINSFEKSKIEKIVEIEQLFYERLISLIKHPKEESFFIRVIKYLLFLFLFCRDNIRMSEIESVHNSLKHHITQIKMSLLVKVHNPVLPELEELRKIRLPYPAFELQRLKKSERIRESLRKVTTFCRHALSLNQEVAFAHSIELREKIKDRYYVINHGQNGEMMLINIIAKKLKQIFEPSQYENFQILRHDVHLNCVKPKTQNVEWFCQRLKRDFDHNYRKELICGDCYLESTAKFESAIDFFAGTTNIALTKPGFMWSVIYAILRNYFPEPTTCEQLIYEIKKLIVDFKRQGTLYSICIPKEQFEKVAFFCTSFGHPVQKDKYSASCLELFQDGVNPWECPEMPHEVYHYAGNVKAVPQIRLLAHMLNPDNGVLIVSNSTVDQATIDQVEGDVELLIQKAQMQFRIN